MDEFGEMEEGLESSVDLRGELGLGEKSSRSCEKEREERKSQLRVATSKFVESEWESRIEKN